MYFLYDKTRLLKIKFPNEGLAGVTKFYRYDSYGEDKKAPWIVERECLNIGGVLPQYHKLSELQSIREVQSTVPKDKKHTPIR